MLGPIPYKSNKTIPWNYGGEIFAGFTELILTGERVKVGIKNEKIQKDASSVAVRKPFIGKKKLLLYILGEIKIGMNVVQWWGLS